MKKWTAFGIVCVLIFMMFTITASATTTGKVETASNRMEASQTLLVNSEIQDSVKKYLSDAPVEYANVFNVKSNKFGAAGNGKKNDTAAIQLALNQAKKSGGGVVYLPEGTYVVSNNLYIYSGTKVMGARAKITKTNTKADFAVLVIAAGQHNVVVEGLWLNNTQTAGNISIDIHKNVNNVWIMNNTFTGIHSQAINMNNPGIEHVQISGNHFEKVSYGLLTNKMAVSIKDIRVINNQFIDIYSDAIELNHPGQANEAEEHFVIAGNYISVPKGLGKSKMAGFGIGIAGADNITITGNVIEKTRYEAIHIEGGAKYLNIIGNIIDGVENDPDVNLNSGIYIIDGSFITISGNNIHHAYNYGIHLEYAVNHNAKNIIISDNTVTESRKGGGIRIAGMSVDSNLILSQNIVTNNTGDGIQVDGSIRNLKITDNIVNDNSRYGLFFKKSGFGWYISGNTLSGNSAGNIGTGEGFITPVPLRDQSAAITAVLNKANDNTPCKDVFSLGTGAEGLLYLTAKQGAAYSTKLYRISWDGTLLTHELVSHDHQGTIQALDPVMNGKSLQVQASSGQSGSIEIEAQFEGLIMLK
ncbi:right-handed parallel beta-helix repeat-containing protein [Paenibacillus solisilvae]|uniref:Right-handed parallel beta-helix repeat-containing protein n=1 Tax=Paenibacillus solisilvae TaxID=2486751 RepID=A0ABW0VX93_9BACL